MITHQCFQLKPHSHFPVAQLEVFPKLQCVDITASTSCKVVPKVEYVSLVSTHD